jgi:hypothetical protein
MCLATAWSVNSVPATLIVKSPLIVFTRDIGDRRGGEDSGIVDQDIDLAEYVERSFDRLVDTRLVTYIHTHRNGGLADAPGGIAGTLNVDIGYRDPRAFSHIGLGEGSADAARGTGNQCALAFKTHHSIRNPCASKR